ncbi:hypothetical protein M9Y10_005081 [Tritrichomonas musculus]|uniref:Uncharacterized protein n=1 Tax=Tritrichomonas musculus TaxID=1915356 RepID=A0ABR2JKN1_9EUKA
MNNTYFLKVQGFPSNFSHDKIRNKLKDHIDSVLDISVGFDNHFLIAVAFTGTKEKCVEELSRLIFNNKNLQVQLIKPFPIFKKYHHAPMLYENESCPYPYFPELQCDKKTNMATNNTNNNNNSQKYNQYNEPINLPSKDILNSNSNFKLPPASEPSTSPWATPSSQ